MFVMRAQERLGISKRQKGFSLLIFGFKLIAELKAPISLRRNRKRIFLCCSRRLMETILTFRRSTAVKSIWSHL